ncbi:MAG: excinuclease ABC subunit A, partial [Spirochaetaceae bacterium]
AAIRVIGARLHNLDAIDVDIPVGRLVSVTGVSGSGKSTLVRDVLYRSVSDLLSARRGRSRPRGATRGVAREGGRGTSQGGARGVTTATGCDRIDGTDAIERALEVDQTPIGKTPRSTPATYIGVWDEIRSLYASIPDARMRGYTASRFSFNTADGRCEACNGQGVQRIEMSFLPDVSILCDECGGKRFTEETLAIHFKGKSIADVLAMDVESAADFFGSQPKIRNALGLLTEVGLGYVTLGQQSPTLSGGEAQRIKLVAELARSSTTTEKLANERAGLSAGHAAASLYILDEPTVGLHAADVTRLIAVLKRLVATGSTVVVVEHNLDLIAASDWIIDLGPEGGGDGGRVVAAGPPASIALTPGSHTGRYLRAMGV